jgi:hypothetical protein
LVKLQVESLPPKVDNHKYCSPVKDQGQLGSLIANMYEYLCKRVKTSYVKHSGLFIY